MTIVVPQLQSSILRVTSRVVLLVHCIAPNIPIFLKKLQNDLNHHTAKKHSAPKPDVTFKCKLCYQEFPGFYASRQQKNIQHGFPIKRANVDPDGIINELDDANLKEEMCSCQHFLRRF